MRIFTTDTLDWFRQACRRPTPPTRGALARELCAREQWFNAAGRPCLTHARQVLPKLAAALGVSLPTPRSAPNRAEAPPATDYPDRELVGPLADWGPVTWRRVDPADRQAGASMGATHHPVGFCRAPGGQVRYWIESAVHGVLGGISFGAAGLPLAPRDQEIGWSADARMARIGQGLCPDRCLIGPSVRVPKLASQGLRLATERVAADWAERYGEAPVLVYPLTGPEYSGLSYRAGGWTPCDEPTSGRRSGVKRTVWWRPLRDDWREILCAEPEHPLGSSPPGWSDEADWAERESGGSPPTDGRLRRRLVAMGRAWLASLGAPLPVIFPARATRLAADRR